MTMLPYLLSIFSGLLLIAVAIVGFVKDVAGN